MTLTGLPVIVAQEVAKTGLRLNELRHICFAKLLEKLDQITSWISDGQRFRSRCLVSPWIARQERRAWRDLR